MAGSAVVGTLRALLTLDTADYDQALVRVSKSSDKWSKDLGAMGRQATAVGKTLTTAITLPLIGLAGSALKAAVDFESSFANVAKTVDGVSDSAGVLTKDGKALALTFRAMAKEIPATTDELNQIAALGGQMGVPIKQLENFTRNVAALGVAVDGISTEDAAIGLAQIGNIAGTGTTQVAEMASALVHLGNNSNATEGDILEFSKRLAGAGMSAGMTVPQVMAIGTAMANVGINAEAGGTAMSTMIAKMSMAVSTGGESLKAFDKVVQHTGQSFTDLWKGSPAEAVNAVIVGLGQMKDQGVDLNLVVRDIGATNIRTSATMKSLALAGDGVSTSLVTANEGWESGNKHLEEAEKKYATTANQMKLLWNNVKDVGISLGDALLPLLRQTITVAGSLVPILDGAVKAFTAMPGPVQSIVLGLLGLASAVGPVTWGFGLLATGASTLMGVFTASGLTTAALTVKLTGLRAVLVSLGPAFAVAGVAIAGWQIGKHIGEISGLTDGVRNLTERLFDLRNTAEPLESQQRTIATAISLGADKAVTFAEALTFLKDRAAQLRSEHMQGEAATVAVTVATDRAVVSAEALAEAEKKQAEAAEHAKAWAKALSDELERQDNIVRSLGLVTKQDAVTAMEDFQKALEAATKRGGIPLDVALSSLRPKLVELINKAQASGIATDDMREALEELDATVTRLRGGVPVLTTQIGRLGDDAGILARRFGVVTGEMIGAQGESYRLKTAFETLGISTQASLDAAAQKAREAYATMAAAGWESAAQQKAARQAVLDAELAAGQRTISLWESEILPAVQQAGQNIVGSLSTNFIDMLTGATSFKDGFVNIWNDLKSVVTNLLNSLLQTFLNEFLGGMLQGLMGWARQAGQIIGGVQSAAAGSMLPPSAIGIGAPGAGVGAGGVGVGVGGALATAGLGALAGGAAYTLGKMATEWAGAFFGEHFTDQSILDRQAAIDAAVYTGAASRAGMTPEEFIDSGGVPGFSTGTNGQYVDFGAGTLAMLHGKEKITPMGSGGDTMHVTFVTPDGQKQAEYLIPFLPGAAQRLGVAW